MQLFSLSLFLSIQPSPSTTMDAIHYASPDAPRRASLVAPAKSASAGARKSGQPASLAAAAGVLFQQQESRTARKTSGPRIYRDEEHPQSAYTVDKDADENTSPARSIAVKSSSATSPSIASIPAADTSSSSNNTKPFTHGAAVKTANTSASDESSSILAPLVQSRRGDKDNIASIPPGAHRPGFGKGKGRGKDYAPPAAGKGGKLLPFKRKAEENTSSDSLDRREGTDETEEDQSSSINVRSRSPRGVGRLCFVIVCQKPG